MRYFVAIPIPEPLRSQLAAVKASVRPPGWRDTMDPHLTVLAPSRPLLPLAEAGLAFSAIELRIPPFNITAHHAQRFSRHRRHTLVLVPNDATRLTDLFNTLIAQCTWQETAASIKRPYQPHITLAHQVPDHQLSQVEAALTSNTLTVDFECTQVVLYHKQASWPRWQELRSVTLT